MSKATELLGRMEKLGLINESPADLMRHEDPTGDFAQDPAKEAKKLKKFYKTYKEAMAALQYFENRWGKGAETKDLKKIEQTRVELRKLFGRDKDGNLPK